MKQFNRLVLVLISRIFLILDAVERLPLDVYNLLEFVLPDIDPVKLSGSLKAAGIFVDDGGHDILRSYQETSGPELSQHDPQSSLSKGDSQNSSCPSAVEKFQVILNLNCAC